jgi:Fe-S-cluster containining protein
MRANPCVPCGACCALYRVTFHWREADDSTPGGIPVEVTRKFNEHRLILRGTNGDHPRCVALAGEIGISAFCSIYDRRPTPCREFAVSYADGQPDERCARARLAHGLLPLTPDDWERTPPDTLAA